MPRQMRSHSQGARSKAAKAKPIQKTEGNPPPVTEGEVLQAAHAAIYLVQRARALTKSDKGQPLIACIGGLTITLQTDWNFAPLYREKQSPPTPPYGVGVRYQANLVLDVRWNGDNCFVAYGFERGPWIEILLRAAHPEQVSGDVRSSQLQDKE